MKKGTRLYINVTNNCNYKCPFFCMYCGPDKNRFMTLDQYRKIIDDCQTDFEVQLEGVNRFSIGILRGSLNMPSYKNAAGRLLY